MTEVYDYQKTTISVHGNTNIQTGFYHRYNIEEETVIIFT